MDRPTKEIEVAGHKLVVKTYITAREAQPAIDKQDAPLSQRSNAMLQMAILSLDGSADNILERLLDLPLMVYTEITKSVAELTNPTTPAK